MAIPRSSVDSPARSALAAAAASPHLLTRIRQLTREINTLEAELRALVRAHRPRLLAETGCGALIAATLIGRTAGAQRFATDARFARQTGTAPIPASSGNRNRHRLHRGGDRQLNRALHMIAITRARHDPATRAYLERKTAEGKTPKQAIRCLKRHLARRFHHILAEPHPTSKHAPIPVSAPSPTPRLT